MTSKLKVNLINDSGDNNIITSDGSGNVTLGTAFPSVGKLGQVIQAVKTDTGTINSQTFTTISSLSLNITPTATSSKILLMMNINASGDRSAFRFLRDSTAIGVGDTAGSRIQATNASPSSSDMFEVGMTFLDSPNSNSQLTFLVQARNLASSTFLRINRKETDTDNNEHPRTICTLTAMEILA